MISFEVDCEQTAMEVLERVSLIQFAESLGGVETLITKGLGLGDKKLDDLIVHKAGLWLDAGSMFGAGGEGFQRVTIGCPLSVLEKAFVQLEQAVVDNTLNILRKHK